MEKEKGKRRGKISISNLPHRMKRICMVESRRMSLNCFVVIETELKVKPQIFPPPWLRGGSKISYFVSLKKSSDDSIPFHACHEFLVKKRTETQLSVILTSITSDCSTYAHTSSREHLGASGNVQWNIWHRSGHLWHHSRNIWYRWGNVLDC